MQEALLYFPEIKDIRPSATIEDLHLIKEIVAKFGYKTRTVAHPNAEEKEEIVSLTFIMHSFVRVQTNKQCVLMHFNL